jgi:hypothetical protein
LRCPEPWLSLSSLDLMPHLHGKLDLERCPHCHVDTPHFDHVWTGQSTSANGVTKRFWAVYFCNRCGGAVIGAASKFPGESSELYPAIESLDEAIPTNARTYLRQAISSQHAPAGAVMLAASAVDAMLKSKGYRDGSLYSRIEKAVSEHLITEDMGTWAHEVRLDANEQRHADDNYRIPEEEDARRVIEFAKALALFLFVLPNMVKRGISDAAPSGDATAA